MISKIKYIKNLAVFQNFSWDSSVQDNDGSVREFKKTNIIYGRNYSGKTTLSRIFRALETYEFSTKYDDPKFSVSINGQPDITLDNLNECSKKVRVFNEDFVRDNLRFIVDPNGTIKPFAIFGGNANLEMEINTIKAELGKKDREGQEATGLYKTLLDHEEDVTLELKSYEKRKNKLDNQLKGKATNRINGIKYKPERFGDQNYTKPKLEAEIAHVLSPSYEPLNNQEQADLEKLLNEKANKNIEGLASLNFAFRELTELTSKLVRKKISTSDKIDELVKNAVLNRWVKEGRTLHRNQKDNCSFCGSTIENNRWKVLDKHFDEESEELEKEIDSAIEKIGNEKQIISSGFLLDQKLFYAKFHPDIIRLGKLYRTFSKQYIQALETLEKQLADRKDDIINPVTFVPPLNLEKRVSWLFDIYENIRAKANSYTDLLEQDQTKAKKSLRLKEVFDFAETIDYANECSAIDELEKEYDDALDKKNKCFKKIETKENEIEEKKRLLNDEEKGALKVNEYLNDFFGHQFLTLKAIEEENGEDKNIRFEVIRDGKTAHHLSEGECSLLAFCYFMAKLNDIDTKDSKPIIWIDDPISSLDGNHIFFVYSLINSEIVTNDISEQLFISTHNLDFLKYLKRLPKAEVTKETKTTYRYLVLNRMGKDSEIRLMPSYLREYVTEFNYLFLQLYNCSKYLNIDESNYDVFYNYANNARKFLEVFLYYKYPSGESQKIKLERFFGDNAVPAILTDRINNEYSHLCGVLERGSFPIEVPEMNSTAKLILKRIEEMDSDQYQSLLKSIGV